MPVTGQSANDKWMQRFWRRGRIRTLIPYGIFGLLLIIAIVILGEEIEHHLSVIEAWISNLGLFGVLAYIVLFILLTSVFVPDTVMGIIAGTLFGLTFGIIAVFAGALAGSALQYWLSRRLLRIRIENIVASRPTLASIQRAIHKQEFRLQLLLRMTPVSPVMTSYLLGVSGVRFSGFLIACFGLLPAFFLEVYFGYAARHIARMASRNELAIVLHDVLIIGGFISAAIVMFLVSRMARQAIDAAASSGSDAQ
jgi:uncharacterized membrane protein YdjX (TVP38/TMEM64 family)